MISIITETIQGIELRFHTSQKLFSPRSIDKGTLAMLSVFEFTKEDKVLDLGCGYGVVGILAAKKITPQQVTMMDIEEEAVQLSKENASLNGVGEVRILQSNGYEALDDKEYTMIISNPPYHEDFSVPKMFIEKGFNRLALGGRMYMVTKRETWYKKKLMAIFGGVRVWHIEDYFVFMAVKKQGMYAKKK